MAAPQTAGLPPDLDIVNGYSIVFRAVSSTTGANVTGVKITNASIYAANLTGSDLAAGDFTAVPVLVKQQT